MHPLPASLLAASAGLALLWQATDGAQAFTAESARRLAVAVSPRPIPAFALETMSGSSTRVPLADRFSIVEFIYTSCPTLCQSAGPDMRQLADRLTREGLSDQVALYSVSFDPDFDTVDRLAAYGEQHKADGRIWTVARPDAAQLPGILDAFGVVVIPDGMGGYVHNVAVHVITPDGRLKGIHDTRDFDAVVRDVREHRR